MLMTIFLRNEVGHKKFFSCVSKDNQLKKKKEKGTKIAKFSFPLQALIEMSHIGKLVASK